MIFGGLLDASSQANALEDFMASLAEGHDDLGARIRLVTHGAKSVGGRVNLHAHYLAFRDGKPTLDEFVKILYTKLVSFCLSRKQITDAQTSWVGLPAGKILESAVDLHRQALDLFIRANRNSNRNGEFGELIAYLLIEYVLKAPQFVAKMSLKTSSQMPVHGSDGIHMSYDAASDELKLYWGESKCYADVNAAIDRAAESVAENLQYDKMGHEVFLVRQGLDLSAFPEEFRQAIMSFLDPYDEKYNDRADVSVMFIAFDFDAFAELEDVDPKAIDTEFSKQLADTMPIYAGRLDTALAKHNVKHHSVEIFFLPVPSIAALRKMFQDRVGWTA